MSEQFRDYVTGTSFSLSLSRRMIETLCYMDRYGWALSSISTARSLHERGLVEWAHRERADAGESINYSTHEYMKFRLTDAGKAVIPLLKLAGLYPEFAPDPVELPPVEVVIRMKEHGCALPPGYEGDPT